MFKKRSLTSKDYKDRAFVYYIISGFALFGIMFAGLVEEFDKSMLPLFLLLVTSFIAGSLLKRKSHKETN